MEKQRRQEDARPICKERNMELLAPAGSYEQAVAAIASGCDALYGGMAQWNARNRAKILHRNSESRCLIGAGAPM